MRYVLGLLVLVGCGTASGGPAPPTDAGQDVSDGSIEASVAPIPPERIIPWGRPASCGNSNDCVLVVDPVDGFPGTSPNCGAGLCRWACRLDRANCDGMNANGCEADVSTDTNCGTCGTACGAGMRCTRVCPGAAVTCQYLCR